MKVWFGDGCWDSVLDCLHDYIHLAHHSKDLLRMKRLVWMVLGVTVSPVGLF